MAEGAHLTSAVLHDKPSFFEVLAQESLMLTVRPAIKHAIRFAAETRPDRFGWLIRYFEEIYTALDLVLEHYYLKKYCSTFAEHFYSLKRVSSVSENSQLPRSVLLKSLLCVVLVPYIKLKLDELFERLRHAYNTYVSNREMPKLGKAFVAMYPYIHTVWEGTILAYQTAYLFGKCDWHSPFLHFTGVVLNNDTDLGISDSSVNSQAFQNLSVSAKIVYYLKKVLNMAAVSVSTSLSVGVFFIQFLDWWYASDSSHSALTSLPVPEPPQRDSTHENSQFNVCPICHRTRSNDTALSVSGYVFCYPCIYEYVKEYRMCPVTKYPAHTDHLIKLYVSAS